MKSTKNKNHYFLILIYLSAFYISTKFNEYLLPFGRHSKLFLYTTLFFVGIFIFKQSILKSFIEFKEKGNRYILYLVGGFLLNIILQSIVSSFTPDRLSSNHIRVEEALSLFSPFVVIPVLGVFGPIVEELIFRRIYISELANLFVNKRNIAIWFFMVFSGIVFGVHHMHSFSDFVFIAPYIATGVAFGITYILTNENLIVVIIWHCFNNTLGLIGMAMALQ